MQRYDKIDIPEIIGALFNITSDSICDCPEYAEDIEFTTPDKTRLICRFFPADRKSPTLLYFHDSMAPVEQYDEIAKHYISQDMNFMLATYRGIRKNSGKPGFASLFEDAAFILQKTVSFLQKDNFEGPIFVMGASLGSACVIDITYNYPDLIKGMIIESGFCDTVPFLTGLGLDTIQMDLSEDDGFNNIKKIEKVKLPTLIFHGSRDDVVPAAQAETLQASSGARNKQFHLIPGANRKTLIETGGKLYFMTIKNFVDTVSGRNTWRQRRRNRLNE
jgi:alpha-beta hydrolase superfamily lysophospholipase